MQTWVVGGPPQAPQPDCQSLSFSADGLTVFWASSGGTLVSGDTNAAFDVFALDLDVDDDGMSVGWEGYFRLSDASPADASLDPDNDGVHQPAGVRRRHATRAACSRTYLAEGAQNGFFDTEIAVFKPATTVGDSVSIVAQFLGQNGRRTTSPLLNLSTGPNSGDLFLFSEASLGLETFPLPDQAFSTLVESEQPLAVERTLTWGGGMGAGYGSHAERAISGPAATWYFAEGATHGAFDLFYLLQNPGVDGGDGHHHLSAAGAAGSDRARPTRCCRTAGAPSTSTRRPGLGATDVSAGSTPTSRSSPSGPCT